MNLGIHAIKLLSYDPPEVKRFFDPKLHARCERGHLRAKTIPHCPLCHPRTTFLCLCDHSQYTHTGHCLVNGCFCQSYQESASLPKAARMLE